MATLVFHAAYVTAMLDLAMAHTDSPTSAPTTPPSKSGGMGVFITLFIVILICCCSC